jgi:hypothetical protein
VDKEFTARDQEVGYEESTATYISLKGSSTQISGKGASDDDGIITIKKEGSYVFSGSLKDGRIIIDAGEKAKIQLILNGATINCKDSAPIYIKSADKVFITLTEGTQNTLTDGATYVQTDDNTVDGVIFGMSDITFNGEGTLNINANYKHGIVSKDELVFTGGNYNINAVKDAINGKDCIKIKAGTYNLSSTTGNAMQSKNDEDKTKGYVYVKNGVIKVTACNEGIEGTAIVIDGGAITITAKDDGLNASSGTVSSSATVDNQMAPNPASNGDGFNDDFGTGFRGGFGGGGEFVNNTDCYITVNGGSISINALGDGVDSNGSINISGGEIYVSGPTANNNGGMDYNGMAQITGGIVVIAGSAGMAQGFSDSSTQYSILNNLDTAAAAGTQITLTDKDGKVIVSFTSVKQYQSVVISSPKLKKGETYTLSCGDQSTDITLSTVVTSNGQQGGFPGMGRNRGNRPDGLPGENMQPGQKPVTDQGTGAK